MSMSTHVVGFRPADEKWNKMKDVWQSCESAGIPIPREVQEFFQWERPDNKPGMEVSIKQAVRDWIDNERQGFEIDVTKLPFNVTVLRFYNAY